MRSGKGQVSEDKGLLVPAAVGRQESWEQGPVWRVRQCLGGEETSL